MTGEAAIATYEAHAETLRDRYDAVASEDVLSAVIDLLPAPPAPMLDAGAGSGRDSAWFAARGHDVTAAEPVAAFRAAIRARLPDALVMDTRLPDLEGIDGAFSLILANAIWHHLPAATRAASLARMVALLAPGGRLILSLRHGPVPDDQPIHPLDAAEEIARAEEVGLVLLRHASAPSHQPQNRAADVTWTWLAFERSKTDDK
jgi:SAM-dependent methyltransferase